MIDRMQITLLSVFRLGLLILLGFSSVVAMPQEPRKFLGYNHMEEENAILQEFGRLPWEEQNLLKLFFYDLFATNELGYTLFGDKPMSFCFPLSSYVGFSTRDNIFKIYRAGHLPIYHAWKVWDKLKKLPKNENFVLIAHEKCGIPATIFFINKSRFVSVFNDNIDLFRGVYGETITAYSFLKDLEDKRILPEELFQHHILLGILLGYGRHNAELFQRREVLWGRLTQVPFLDRPKPEIGFAAIEEELAYLNKHLQPIDSRNSSLMLVSPICFVADFQDEETWVLKKKYEALHKELTALICRDDWLYWVLTKLGSIE